MKITYTRKKGVSSNKQKIYIDADDVWNARMDLNKNGFALWLYMMRHKGGWTARDEDHNDICKTIGLSYDALNDGLHNLLNKSYAIEVDKRTYEVGVPDIFRYEDENPDDLEI